MTALQNYIPTSTVDRSTLKVAIKAEAVLLEPRRTFDNPSKTQMWTDGLATLLKPVRTQSLRSPAQKYEELPFLLLVSHSQLWNKRSTWSKTQKYSLF